MWRIGQVTTDALGNPLAFPQSDENIYNWTAHVLLRSDATYTRKFFYPPSVTLERGYDLVFTGTGDREAACSYPGDGTDARDPLANNTAERIYVVKDFHSSDTWLEADLVDVTDPTDPVPDLNSATSDVDGSGDPDQGWYIRLVDVVGEAVGEKVLAEGTVFYKTLYITTFTPNDDPCQPGGEGTIYGLEYKTGAAAVDWDKSDASVVPQRSYALGGGIPSKAVTVITEKGEKLFISIGSTNPDAESLSIEAGIISLDPKSPPINFFYLWWKEL
jgi:type IV pilus assembly protein PilY1